MKVFNEYADYYDLFYKDKNYSEEVDYVLLLMNKYAQIPVRDILDLGCGTGRHISHFCKQGVCGVGVDYSLPMLVKAQQNVSGSNWQFVASDVRNIALYKQFDAVISLFHVASYQIAERELSAFIRSGYNHLKKGGIFLFDFWHGPAVLKKPPVYRKKEIEFDGKLIKREAYPLINKNRYTVRVKYIFSIKDKSDQNVSKFTESHNMRYWFEDEIIRENKTHAISQCKCFEWMTEKALSSDNWNGLCLLVKQ